MTEQNETSEDQNLLLFHDVYDSPAKSDASSVDIYDDLDMSAFAENPLECSTPPKDCLDLYEELLTEEGNAKEASFKDLNADYAKSQTKLKELITKLKEMQSQNASLQNENQCLKKNISALIKTARVEITRKDEEIDRLQRSTKFQNRMPNTPLLNRPKTDPRETKSVDTGASNVETTGKSDPKLQDKLKSTTCNVTPRNMPEKETHLDSQEMSLKIPYVKLLNENLNVNLRTQVSESKSEAEEKKIRKEKEIYHKDNIRKDRKEEHKNSSAANEKINAQSKSKSYGPTSNPRSQGCQESTNAKSVSYEVDSRKHCTWDKHSATKERVQLRDENRSKDKSLKASQRSPCKRESIGYENSKKIELRHRTDEREENELRRSKRKNLSYIHNESVDKSAKSGINEKQRNVDIVRREKRPSNYSKDLRSGSSGSKEEKTPTSRNEENDRKLHKSARSERDKKKDERKSFHDNKDGNKHAKNDRREHKEYSEREKKTVSPLKQGRSTNRTEEQFIRTESRKKISKNKDITDQNEDTSNKDLKLSFMETLNLTLSPMKNQPGCESDERMDKVPVLVECCVSAVSEAGNKTDTSPQAHVQISSIEQEKSLPTHSDNTKQTDTVADAVALDKATPPDLGDMKQTDLTVNANLSEKGTLTNTFQKLVSINSQHASEDVLGTPAVCLLESKLTGNPETNAPLLKTILPIADLESVSNDSFETDEMETRSAVDMSDAIELDSFIEIDRCSGSESSAPNSDDNNNVQNEPCPAGANLPDASSQKPNINETTKEISSNNSTDSCCVSVSEELNKENCHPEAKTELNSKKDSCPQLAIYEVEEGEIVSDNEEDTEPSEPPNLIKNTAQQYAVEQEKRYTSPRKQKKQIGSLVKPKRAISPPRQGASKCKKIKNDKALKLTNLSSKKPNTDSCLEGILNIVQPSTIQDIFQMLRVIRKHIRKKYMKFKIQFSVRQFHTVIEKANLYFLTLVKTIDWSQVCSSSDSLQKNLCKCIDSKLKWLKKNAIVDRIFEQRLIDMKKKLWKFVEDQLDSLFDKLKTMLTKLCNKAKSECNIDETNLKKNAAVHIGKSSRVKSCKKSRSISKFSTPKSCVKTAKPVMPCETHVSSDKIHIVKKLSCLKEGGNESAANGNDSLKNIEVGMNTSPESEISGKIGSESLKCHTDSSSLSFNLVNDDHMGEIFKSLLHISDPLDKIKPLEENLWICKTPEKPNPSKKCEGGNFLTEDTTPIKESEQRSSLWLLSPENSGSFSRLDTLPNPDVLDESCMLEIPTCTSYSKSNILSSEENTRSYSSILVEDLAVSLTVPSPLKSDSHLSFLRPDAEYILEEVVVTCNSEDAIIEGEDATEQDIHLTLDSDNSSSCSLMDPNETSSFQYHPSEPMQAVIMEKSNDHFIVKIRRAVSTASPTSEFSISEDIAVDDGHKVQTDTSNKVAQDGSNLTHGENETVSFNEPQTEDLSKTTDSKICKQPLQSITSDTTDGLLKLPEPFCDIAPPETISDTKADLSCQKETAQCGENMAKPTETIEDTHLKGKDQSHLSITVVDREKSVKKNTKKRSKTFKHEPLAKRTRTECLLLNEKTKRRSRRSNKQTHKSLLLATERSCKKHKRSASEGGVPVCVSSNSPNSLSAKNIIKKKGEVVESWTREEDRAILLDCQKQGPNEKTFVSLSAKMNKYPYQIEERFRQLMKLFKKCRRSTS
ncbi:CASP8-associated protein 2 isoform X2 [Bombina bombina]|uniref:CASP8-associated protein 2 isoform X2 n=1 Tax=Bombina bombina TaxID=8345 RepID=UPI00235B214B|nr:CASP8-associated protein 2 isoform X2 [Bombina bombina]